MNYREQEWHDPKLGEEDNAKCLVDFLIPFYHGICPENCRRLS